MKSHLAIRRLLAILMIAGLALAPLSRPVMAQVSFDSSMQAMMDGMSASMMTDERADDTTMGNMTMDHMSMAGMSHRMIPDDVRFNVSSQGSVIIWLKRMPGKVKECHWMTT